MSEEWKAGTDESYSFLILDFCFGINGTSYPPANDNEESNDGKRLD